MMFKRKLTIILLIGVLGLAACTAPQAAPAAQATQTPAQANAAPGANPGRAGNFNLPTEEKLAPGIYLLEKTAAPVTAQQAKDLIPLWQQVLLLTADTNATQDQIQAVYTKIESTLTADQMKSIEAVTFADMQSVMSILDIQMPAGFGQNGGPQNGNPPNGAGQPNNQGQSQRETRIAEMQTSTAQGTPNPNIPNGTPGAPRFQGTPGASFNNRRGGMLGTIFIEPLIQFLQQKAGS
jgi:hypothetical protein